MNEFIDEVRLPIQSALPISVFNQNVLSLNMASIT